MNFIQTIIKEICEEKNIEFNLVSKDWIIVLKKNNKVRYISGYKFDLNNHAVGNICDDKYALYDTLKLLNIPIIEHKIVFRNYSIDDITSYGEKYNYDLVVKSNTGTCGNGMFHITTKEELLTSIDKLLIRNYSISICPFYKIKNEYRSIILDNNIELFYGKKRPIVIGDGIKTIKELLCEFNNNYFSTIKDDKLDKILDKNVEFIYNWQHNLSKGSIPFEENDTDLKNKIQTLAIDTFKKLNLRFASVDIVELESGEIMILEINSGVMIDNYTKFVPNGRQICKNIYSKAIDKMFE